MEKGRDQCESGRLKVTASKTLVGRSIDPSQGRGGWYRRRTGVVGGCTNAKNTWRSERHIANTSDMLDVCLPPPPGRLCGCWVGYIGVGCGVYRGGLWGI